MSFGPLHIAKGAAGAVAHQPDLLLEAGASGPLLSMRNAVTQMQLLAERSSSSQQQQQPTQHSRHGGVGGGGGGSGGTALLERMKAFSKLLQSDAHAVSGCQQFVVLLRLMMLKVVRNHAVLAIQLFHHVFCGLIFGLIFFRAANEGQRMFDHLKFCIGVVFFVAYTQVIVPVLACEYCDKFAYQLAYDQVTNYNLHLLLCPAPDPAEVKLLKKECFNRWYGLWPYYVAFTISRLPFQIVFNVIFLSMTYWMSGLPADGRRFAMYLLVGLVVSFVAEGLGLAIGATFSITVSVVWCIGLDQANCK